MINLFREWQFDDKPPSVIVAGSGLSLIKNSNFSENILKEFSINMTRLVQPIDRLSNNKFTRVLWALHAPVNEEKLLSDEKITNEQINLYNTAAVDVSLSSAFH